MPSFSNWGGWTGSATLAWTLAGSFGLQAGVKRAWLCWRDPVMVSLNLVGQRIHATCSLLSTRSRANRRAGDSHGVTLPTRLSLCLWGADKSPGPCLLFSTAKTGLGAGTPSRRLVSESLDQTRLGFFQSID